MLAITRRSFLKGLGVAAGGVLSSGPRPVRSQEERSRVVRITDGRAWTGTGWADPDLDADALVAMLRRALVELTGRTDAASSLAALFPSLDAPDTGIGIKVNCVNRDLPTHPGVVHALIRLLIEAGARAGDIIVFDRHDGELASCGFTIQEAEGPKIYGSAHAGVGYDEQAVTLSDASVRLSRILTEQVDHLINVPVLKNHQMAGVTLALKNHYGSIDRPDVLHGAKRNCSPGIAEVNSLPAIREKTRLVVIDAMFGTYLSGLGSKPDFAPMSLLLSTDPVAADSAGQRIINERRAEDGLDPIDAQHIRDASAAGLGRSDMASIDFSSVEIHPAPTKAKPWEKEPSGCSTTGSTLGGVAALAAGAVALRAAGKSQG